MKKWMIVIGFSLVFVTGAIITFKLIELEYAYTPSEEKIISENKVSYGYDLWGEFFFKNRERNALIRTKNGDLSNTSDNTLNGAVKVDNELLELGKDTFYKETFGNEVFMTDIMGVVDGAFTIPNVMKAIAKLGGKGTTNLRVELAEDVTIGDKTYNKGEKIDTGIDVPKGSHVPLGLPIKVDKGEIKVGISCVACHATVTKESRKVIEGVPNADFNLGLIMALATNSTAYFTHTEIKSLKDYLADVKQNVVSSTGVEEPLPDPEKLERAVDEMLVQWPKGNFDSTIDMINNPAQIPDSFTVGDHPFGWSGFAAAGPFNGLSTFSSNVHAQNSDSLSQADASKPLFGIDKEVYLGTILQNAADEDFRYDRSAQGKKPSEFFAEIDPTPGVPGVNELVKSPSYPKVSFIAPDGLIASSPGLPFNMQNNGVAAYQNTIRPPRPEMEVSEETVETGRRVFSEAGCISCHAGGYLTNNKLIPVEEIGTEPTRAKSLKKLNKIFGKTTLFSEETPVPIPLNAKILEVPTDHLTNERKLGWAYGTKGGYKVPSLIGLYWTAPYLHDGGVAVGENMSQLGVPGTLMQGIPIDPRNSLVALIDKNLRQSVINANKIENLQSVHVEGIGHAYWVDETNGFTKQEQDALVDYLLTIQPPND